MSSLELQSMSGRRDAVGAFIGSDQSANVAVIHRRRRGCADSTLTKAGLRQIRLDSLPMSQSQRHYAYAEASSSEPTVVELAEVEADAVSVVEVEEGDDVELVCEP
jgi:hypothetical protein